MSTSSAPALSPTLPDNRQPKPKKQGTGTWVSVLRNPKSVVATVIVLSFVLLALLAPVLAPGDPSIIQAGGAQPPSAEHLLGTTPKGQDVFALTIWGARSSLFVGFVVGIASTIIGVAVGLGAAYFGRGVDDVLSLLTNVFILLPGLPLLVILAAFLPPGVGTVIVVLIITGWAGAARGLRSQALSIRGKDFVAAAQVTGERAPRIIVQEILPNMASMVMGTLLGGIIGAIGGQAGLEFLGLGDPTNISWGTNLYWANTDGTLTLGYWWAFIPSGLCIALVAFAFALYNYALDEVTNPRLRKPKNRKVRSAGATTIAPAVRKAATERRAAGKEQPAGGDTPVLEVTDLSVVYQGDKRTVTAVDRVSFSIAPGEIFGLAGESGCGKSTIANAIMRLLKDPAVISTGSIKFCGKEVFALSDQELSEFRWRDVAMVFQSAMNSLNPVMTIGDQIADIFIRHEGLSQRDALKRAATVLDMVQIDHGRLKAYPHQLSGGMRQRVVIAMAAALRPKLLIMDEPTTALDVVVQQEILAQIGDLQEEFGFSILFITHDMSLMIELSDRIGVMYSGRLVELAPAKELKDKPLHEYTHALMNAFPPITGPREDLAGLGDGVKFTDIGDLVEAEPGHFVAPATRLEGAVA